MTSCSRIKKILLGCLLILSIPAQQIQALNITVLYTREVPAYPQITSHILQTFSPTFPVTAIDISETPLTNQLLQKLNTELIITVGPKAADTITIQQNTLPLIATMLIHPKSLKSNTPTLLLSSAWTLPIEEQLKVIQSAFLSPPKTIGTIYLSADQFDEKTAIQTAKQLGITLKCIQLSGSAELPTAIRQLIDAKVELFWPVPDTQLYSKQLLLYTMRQFASVRIPSYALSPAYLKFGAVVATDIHYDAQSIAVIRDALLHWHTQKPNTQKLTPQQIEWLITLQASAPYTIVRSEHPQWGKLTLSEHIPIHKESTQ